MDHRVTVYRGNSAETYSKRTIIPSGQYSKVVLEYMPREVPRDGDEIRYEVLLGKSLIEATETRTSFDSFCGTGGDFYLTKETLVTPESVKIVLEPCSSASKPYFKGTWSTTVKFFSGGSEATRMNLPVVVFQNDGFDYIRR